MNNRDREVEEEVCQPLDECDPELEGDGVNELKRRR